MTGTSIDGLDTALVAINGKGLEMTVSVKRCLSRPLGELALNLMDMAHGKPMTAKQTTSIARDLSLLHLNTLKKLVCDEQLDLVAVHGQTVVHKPPLSWQLINPAPIAYGLGAPVVSDFRAADLALGGQGAPITPIADYVLFRSATDTLGIVNMGGFCNLTLLPKISETKTEHPQSITEQISGQDVCVCNQLLDSIARALFKMPFDKDGTYASTGHLRTKPFEDLVSCLEKQSNSTRSLGTGDELADWIERHHNQYRPEDLARSACAAIASTIAQQSNSVDRIILSGGGVKNLTLVGEIQNRSNVPVELSDTRGIPSTYREAIAIAVLGALCQDRVPITLPHITGSSLPTITGTSSLPISGTFIMP